MAKCGFRVTKDSYFYRGSVEDCLDYAKRKLFLLETNSPYIDRRFIEEKKRYDTHHKAIFDCKGFIRCMEQELEKQKNEKVGE